MKFTDFKKAVSNTATFSPLDYLPPNQEPATFKLQVSQWKKLGYLVPLKRNLYTLNAVDRKITPSRIYIANQLVFPSYVSLEYMLSFYGIIPERVYQVTSVTSKKTQNYSNSFGTFSFTSLQTFRYFGYQNIKDENNLPVWIADKEKAFLDFLYFKVPSHVNANTTLLEDSFRMQNLEELDMEKLAVYTEKFRSKKLDQFLKNIF